jgi:succinyl-CoA synthetase alpha subunit
MNHMLDYNSNVCAGVCYLNNKDIDFRGVPIYHHLQDAIKDYPGINISIIASGAYEVLQNCLEALESGIKTIVINTNFIPLKDVISISQEAEKYNAIILGPNSTGIINPDIVMVGSMGGIHSLSVFKKGNIGIISRSNGLLNEASIVFKNCGMGVSTAVALGTEQILLSSFVDIYKYFMEDKLTKTIVLIGGPGWHGEEEFAEYYSKLSIKKPVIAFLAGSFVDELPSGFSFGHISSIRDKYSGSVVAKKRLLENAGIPIASFIQDIPNMIKH